ncbi:Bug family tripartite tricarboxylate transporter substrate binding protein [Cupriavidus sp. 2TAF22]|uniref:Bug family tripartite tricarboxylate transporter substrate binding protein n=1 Tax=unclassified Cupriavidus TaxID=2640874 RepID=UPI003F8F1E04
MTRSNTAAYLAAGAASLLMLAPHPARAGKPADFPTHPIRIIVPYAAGGGTDIIARTLGAALSRQMGQPVVVDNRPGGQTIVGYSIASKAAPDGYTLLMNNSAHSIQPALFKDLPYDAIKSFRGVAEIAASPVVFVVDRKLPVTDLKSYVAYGKAASTKLNFGSFGAGTGSHLWGELLASATGLDMMHVPYKGSAPAIQDLIGGQINGLFVDPLAIKPHVQAGTVRAIGVTGPRRWKGLESVPTFVEQGYPQFADVGWFGLFAPAGTPDAVVNRLSAEVAKAVALPEVKSKLLELGTEPSGTAPAAFDAQIRKDADRWAKVVTEKHITLQ